MGVVYEAVHVDLDRPVALKVLDARATRDGNGLRRFLNEAKTAAGLHHTHIVPVFDVGHVGGLCYYAMQRIEGSGLDRVLKVLRRGRSTAAGSGSGTPVTRTAEDLELSGLAPEALTGSWGSLGKRTDVLRGSNRQDDAPPTFEPPRGSAYFRWVAEAGRQAAQALAHAHRRGVVHRDVKPSNLLVDARGTVWVADFGLARRLADPSLTHSDSLLGTPRYMSPEQGRSGPVDGRTDVYSLGATLYELLTLRPPFEGRTTAELIEQISQQEPIPPRRHDARIPRDLETIVLKALSKRPADRYQSAAELAEDLQRFLLHEPVKARRIGPLGRTWRLARRHPAIAAVSTTAAIVVLTVASVAYWRVSQEVVETKNALIKAEEANRKANEAIRRQLLSQASLTRTSTLLNRRNKGLNLLKQAAGMEPEPPLRTELRDEAIAILALRDVEERKPLPVGAPWGLTFSPVNDHLATLSSAGPDAPTMLSLWTPSQRRRFGAAVEIGPSDNMSRDGRGFGGFGGNRIAAAGPLLAVLWPDGHGIRLFDASTSDLAWVDLPTPGREVMSLVAASGPFGPRLVTFDRLRPGEREPRDHDPDDRRRIERDVRISLWDPTREDGPIASLVESIPEDLTGPTHPIIAISPDGQTIATSWFRGSLVQLWSAEDGATKGEIDTQSASLTALTLGPYGLLAAAGGGAVRLWQTETRAPLPILTPNQNYVHLLKFSPDGSLLALAGRGSDVELWEPASNTLVAALHTEKWVTDLALSASGRTLTLVAGQPDSVALWAIVDPVVRVRFSGFEHPPSSLAFGPDGLLGMAFGNEPVRVWNPEQCATTIHVRDDVAPTALAFDDQGRLAAFGDSLQWLPNPEGQAEGAPIELPLDGGGLGRGRMPSELARRFQSITTARDGHTLFLTRYNEIFVWHADDNPDRLQRLKFEEPLAWNRLRGRRDGRPWSKVLASPSGDRLYLHRYEEEPQPQVQVWAVQEDTARRLPWRTAPGLDHMVTTLALSPDGLTLALGRRGRRGPGGRLSRHASKAAPRPQQHRWSGHRPELRPRRPHPGRRFQARFRVPLAARSDTIGTGGPGIRHGSPADPPSRPSGRRLRHRLRPGRPAPGHRRRGQDRRGLGSRSPRPGIDAAGAGMVKAAVEMVDGGILILRSSSPAAA